MRKFLMTTIVGGAVFLLPLVVVVMLLGAAVGFAVDLTRPVVDALGIDLWGNIAGVGLVTAIAIAGLIAVCFVAGLIARTAFGGTINHWIENSVLARLPQYQMMKSMASAFGELQSTHGLAPVLVSGEGGWQIGYLVETMANGWKAVFIPQAPTPMSGNVIYLPPERVRALDMSMMDATQLVQRLGIGSGEQLGKLDLSHPVGT